MSGRRLAVIPVRLEASRLPRKPLLELGGRPIVQWVWEATTACDVFDDVLVATPDDEIAQVVTAFGGQVAITSEEHRTGTDRVAEVAAAHDHAIVANVQGDQPFVNGDTLRALVHAFDTDPRPVMTTAATHDVHPERHKHPSTVKVVVDLCGDALYFSRAPIPYTHGQHPGAPMHHLGLYAFDRQFLLSFAALEVGPLELAEGLEQLRVLENGHRIRVASVPTSTLEINTAADLAAARELVAGGRF